MKQEIPPFPHPQLGWLFFPRFPLCMQQICRTFAIGFLNHIIMTGKRKQATSMVRSLHRIIVLLALFVGGAAMNGVLAEPDLECVKASGTCGATGNEAPASGRWLFLPT